MAQRMDRIEVGMDLAVRCRVTETWQDDLGDQWVKVLIEGYDMPVKLKAVHFYPFDDRDVARA
ncbi:hypothetical protein DPM33_12265 [Mesorhizobium hawassense]|uniref:Uncharacterized protein n=2 Tax=Mesorhizobium TaxID=68287 RepID=A0A330HRU6_9HYPH|nr:hypothetical protein [Mesorhizobium hawassense]RAZ91105.1 hypothetical protein DPM33_12265 [Mesorhizobium hawassense]CDX56217.1 conserved hypothetical protein [Mesorhizobium plurifarium]